MGNQVEGFAMVPALVKWFPPACRFRIAESSSKHFWSSNTLIVASIKTQSYTGLSGLVILFMLTHQGGNVFSGASWAFFLQDEQLVVSYAVRTSKLRLLIAIWSILVHEGFWEADGRQLDLPFDVPQHGWHLEQFFVFFILPPCPCPTPTMDLTPFSNQRQSPIST